MQRIGRYELRRPLGEGATSSVHLAWDPFARREVAIKRIYREVLHDPHQAKLYRQTLLNEAGAASLLHHPHIVQVLDADIGDTEAYLVMEYVAGGTLREHCDPAHLLPFERVTEIIFKCARALDFAFTQGITHRDIKPANILLADPTGTDVKISDFGAAIFHDTEQTIISGVGSPAYMSPEQVRDAALTHQTDIYSLGVVMYQLLTGKLPFEAGTQWSIAWKIGNTEPPRPSLVRPDVPPELDAIVGRAMHKSLTARYASWTEFAHDLVQAERTRRLQAQNSAPSDARRFETMREMRFFHAFDDVQIWETLRLAEWREASAGSLIMREDEPGDFFALLASGQASVCSNGQRLHRLETGECFGEVSLFLKDSGNRSADVIADSDCVFIAIRTEALEHASHACQTRIYRAFLETLAQRLVVTSQRLVHP